MVIPVFGSRYRRAKGITHDGAELQTPKRLEEKTKQTVYKHLEDNKLISKSQHGFVKMKSCQTNLIFLLGSSASSVDNGEAVHDFSPASSIQPCSKSSVAA